MTRSGKNRKEYEHRVNRVIDHIRAHKGDELSLETLAKLAAFSPYHFHRIFKAVTGENLAELVQRVRLESAAGALVLRPDADVLGIALDNGFSSASGFARAFKERFGVSATEWREGGSVKWSKARKAEHNARKAKRNPGQAAPLEDRHGSSRGGDEMIHVTVKTLPTVRVAYMRLVGPYGPEGAIADLWGRLSRWAEVRDLWTDDRVCYGIAQDNPHVTELEKCRYDAAIVIGDGVVTDSAVNVTKIPGGRFGAAQFVGTGKDIDKAWDSLFGEWLPQSGYQPDDRPVFERYEGAAFDHATGVVRCDLCVALRPL